MFCDKPERNAQRQFLRTTGGPNEQLSQQLYADWFAQVCERTAQMVAHWMRVGFVHGVMNTDNMSILGLTIDYGPYGWIDNFDLDWTPNTTDAEGRRYRFGHQAQVAYWNLTRLASALAPPSPLPNRCTQGCSVMSTRSPRLIAATSRQNWA